MKKAALLLFIVMSLAALITACSAAEAEQPDATAQAALIAPEIGETGLVHTDFYGKTIGVVIGSICDEVAKKMSAAPAFYADESAGVEDVRNGRIDGFMTGLPNARLIAATNGEDLKCVEVPAEYYSASIGGFSNNQDIINRFNAFLAEIEADGTLTEMQSRWLSAEPDLDVPMPNVPATGENGTLNVAVCATVMPFVYIGADGEFKGYSAELAFRFAAHEGMGIELIDMDFGALISYAASGKADFAIANVAITEERRQSVLFTDPICDDRLGVLVLKSGGDKAGETDLSPRDYTDFMNKTIGVVIGAVSDQVIENDLEGTPMYYSASAYAFEDVRNGRIDGFIWDLSAARVYASSEGNDDLEYVEIPAKFFSAPLEAFSSDQGIVDRFNAFLAELSDNGTLAEMQNRWLKNVPDSNTPIPDIPPTGQNGTLKVAICCTEIPFCYVGNNNEYKGYSVELAIRFAAREGMTVEFIDMDFSGMIPYVSGGKADLGIANFTITEERAKSVLFTDSIYDDQLAIVALKKGGDSAGRTSARDYSHFEGKRIGVATGTIWDQLTENQVGGIAVYYSDMSAAIEDVRKGRLDGYMADLSEARVFTASPDKEDLEYVSIPSEIFSAPMGAISNNQDIIDRFNAFLAGIKADGTLEDMQNRWLENVPDLDSPMPDIPLRGERGVLKVTTSGLALPFSYIGADNELKGYSVELAIRFAEHEGMDIEFMTMGYEGFIAHAAAGKTDICIDSASITEERKESVLFSDSIYDDRAAIIALKVDSETSANRDYTYFSGKSIASITGVLTYITTEKIGGIPVYYSDSSAAAEDVRQGRVTGFMHALSTVRAIAAQPGNEDFEVFAVPKDYFSAQIGGISQDQSVIDSFNEFLAVIAADGTLDDMHNRWFGAHLDLNASMPDIPNTGENGVLKVATCGDALPYAHIGADGELNGFSVELALRYGAHIGKIVEFADVEFGGLIAYIVAEKADISLANMAITEERKQSVRFTEPFFDEQHGILALATTDGVSPDAPADMGSGFINWLRTGIERNLITDNRWRMVVNGLGVTMVISFAAQFFGTVFGCLLCFILTRKNRFAKWIGSFYCGLIHGTPIVVLLMITYYIIFGNANISSILVAIAAFTMVMGAGIAQNLKGAIETVDPVEIEAARSIGFSAFKAFLSVTLPQAVRRALPSYTNGFVELVKSTAIVGYIAIQDLTRAGDIIRSRTYDAYFPLLLVALIYLCVTSVCVWLFELAVSKINGGVAE